MIEKAIFSKTVRRMFGLSLHAWENVMVGSLAFAAFAALVVGIATFAVVKLQRQEIAASKDELERYKLDAGQAIAEAGARAAEANLALEKFKAPRQIKGAEFVRALAGKPKAPVEIVFVRDDAESWALSLQIEHWLKAANWPVSAPAAIAGPDEPKYATSPSAIQAGGQPRGVTIVHRMASEAE
jgi:hypothetical protein